MTSSETLYPEPRIGLVRIESNRDGARRGRFDAVAPAGFVFRAVPEGFSSLSPHFAAWKDLHFRWSFSDPGWYSRHDTDDMPWGRYYDVDGEPQLSPDGFVPPGDRFLGNDKNVAYGPWVAHVWAPNPRDFNGADIKDYTVRCEVRWHPDAPPIVAERVVRLLNPDKLFARSQTFLISTTGNTADPSDDMWASDTYPGAVLCNSFDQAWNAALDRSTGSDYPARFLFCRGQTHDHSLLSGAKRGRRHIGQLQVGAYGDGTPPRLISSAKTTGLDLQFGGHDGPDTECAYWGFDLIGPYDPTDPFSVQKRPSNGLSLSWGRYKTVWDVAISGFDTLISAGPNSKGKGRATHTVIGNSLLTNWMDFGIFWHDGAETIGHCGLWIKQAPGTRIAEGKNDPRNNNQERDSEGNPGFFADHGPYRFSTPGQDPVCFNLIDLRSVNSWLGYIQPCLRHGIEAPPDARVYKANFDRIRGENGQVVHPVVAGYSLQPGNQVQPRAFLYDKIYEVQLQAGGNGMWAMGSAPGIVIRNTISVIPNSAALGQPVRTWIKGTEEDPIDPAFFAETVRQHGFELYNITFADLREAALTPPDFEGITNPARLDWFKYLVLDNNILHTPNRNNDPAGPLDSSMLWTVTWDGLRYRLDPLQSLYATPPDTAQKFAPQPGSAAFRTATPGKLAIDDFYGRLRTLPASPGAVEPD